MQHALVCILVMLDLDSGRKIFQYQFSLNLYNPEDDRAYALVWNEDGYNRTQTGK